MKQVVHDLDLSGCKKLVSKCDQEASVLALRREDKAAANLDVVLPEESPVGEHQSNGVVEHALQ